jgi:hypothetical protein
VTGNVAVNTDKFTVAASSGNTVAAGTLSVTGDVAINTDKFTITASSGNTAVAGTLGVTGDVAVNTDKFTITASSGNTAVAGTLSVDGAADVGDLTIGSNSAIPIRVDKVALTASDDTCGVLDWTNPHSGSAVMVLRLAVDVTTASTEACTLDFGVDDAGDTSDDTLIDGLDVNSATGLFDNIENGGTNGEQIVRVADGYHVVGSMASGAAAGLAGSAYIVYVIL